MTLSPAYFESFYQRIALSTQHATAALVRTDGKLLARYPEQKAVGQLPSNSALLRAAASLDPAGVFYGTSSLDEIFKLAAFQRVDNQPLLASFSLARSCYLGPWYTHIVWMAAFASPTAVALVFTNIIVLRKSSLEEAQLRRLLQESERRKEAEETVQHLQKWRRSGA